MSPRVRKLIRISAILQQMRRIIDLQLQKHSTVDTNNVKHNMKKIIAARRPDHRECICQADDFHIACCQGLEGRRFLLLKCHGKQGAFSGMSRPSQHRWKCGSTSYRS
ncbi:hypothetical protein KP509_09G057000 [Ceratopteris richardii]|uniref:Uncharacterized protein n=1 Tax=Ceratopteris richardii TaxID=49495 RepID=A0A8T2UAQ2_CERRI|nr:hypothetical protein KP509_09G057000 [Ceratopteris richardii]